MSPLRMRHLRLFLETVRFEHTVFALPFAYLGMLLAANWSRTLGAPMAWPTLAQVFWITLAMAAARTVGFAVNRYADRWYDARNPRTADRPIPSGRLSVRATLGYATIALVVLVVAAWQLNTLALMLLPGALLFLVGYSYTKRFTWLSHWILGATDGLAPAGAWVAVRAHIDPPAWLLWLTVTLWIAGFDLIYACQDVAFDRAAGLHAVPARFGIASALRLARINHALTLVLLAALGVLMALGWVYWLALLAIAALFLYEHHLVSPQDLSRVNIAFFNVNGYIALVIFFGTWLALWI
ncbi:MAG: UbiA-like polyprenyltransferase [Anaerolineae bacterium]